MLFQFSMEEFILNQTQRGSPRSLLFPEHRGKLFSPPEMQRVLEKIDCSIFDRKKTHFQLYKQLDQDKDGYVSGNDICEYLEKNNITTANEAQTFLRHLGVQRHQVLFYKELHQKIYENFPQQKMQSEKENQKNIMGLREPDPEKMLAKVRDAKEFFYRLKDSYRVRHQKDNVFCYRNKFKYTPPFQNTFVHFIPDQKSELYQGSASRFDKDLRIGLKEQKEEMLRK